MIEFNNEQDLLNTFRDKDKKFVEIPKTIQFPLALKNYITWSEPGGVRTYLVFKKENWDTPRGIVFKKTHAGNLEVGSRMCDWCHAYGPSDQIGMLTTMVSSKRTVGMLLCLDLSCMQKLEVVSSKSKKSFEKLANDLTQRIGRFFESTFAFREESE